MPLSLVTTWMIVVVKLGAAEAMILSYTVLAVVLAVLAVALLVVALLVVAMFVLQWRQQW